MFEPSSVQLFAGLSREEIRIILAAAEERNFKKFYTIIRTREPATHLFLLKTGCVDFYILTEQGREILLRRLLPGSVFGVDAFLSDPAGYMGTAKTVTDSEVLIWNHRVIQHLARTYPRLAQNALRTALRYLASYARRHIGLVSNTARERLAWALSRLGSRAGHLLPEGVEVRVRNEDLASLADVSIFTASRILKDWERKGIVDKSRGRVLIRCPEKLLAA
ncbi:MAG TPA: Crp/Fnr family transcriptional regulator [Candidatus Baltobacteraceae bacterium]|nr:Crp/Fnr family transcriptional regulator [Candidatus Baltobacteraceae bacterium]